jgi:hypothetical protein
MNRLEALISFEQKLEVIENITDDRPLPQKQIVKIHRYVMKNSRRSYSEKIE